MRFIGLDVHKRIVEAAILDAAGKLLVRCQLAATREEIMKFAERRLRPTDRVALEATTNTWGVVDLLAPYVAEVVVSNPLRTKAIAEAKIKTDKVDAEVLAQLLRTDFLPRVWRPDAHTQEGRRITSRRASLSSDRTTIKNRIHSVLHQRLIPVPFKDLFSRKGRAWLAELAIDPMGREAMDADLRLLDATQAEIDRLDVQIRQRAWVDPRVKLLMTLPGVDVAVAHALISAIGATDRFRDGDHAASYLGLVPSTRQSADHCYHGPITKQGNGHARWLLVQAAQHLGSHPGPLGVFFRKLCKKKNRNVAVVATARKLVVIAWHMLKHNEPYRYALPRPTEAKLSRLRVKATQNRRRGGTPKGTPRPDSYGTGEPLRTVPAIDQVLSKEDLPAIQPLKDGEKAMLRDKGLVRFVQRIRRAQKIPRKSRVIVQDT